MSDTRTVAATITAIRQGADLETADQANDFVTDTELVRVINAAYKALYDLIANRAGHEYFATSASCTPSAFTLPSDFYRLLGVDLPNFYGTNQPYTARRFAFQERNRRAAAFIAAGYDVPTYRVQAGKLVWEPASAAPTSAVTVWYVPVPATLASNGSFDAVNGWDEYVIAWGVRYCKEKGEEDPQSAILRFIEADKRVRENAARIVLDPVVVAAVRDNCDSSYYNS